MDSDWRPLPLRSECTFSPLLIKLDISPTSYDIYLTDLTHIWTESLDRKQIIRRAFDENASIDPSEGPDQFRLLLQNIKEALEGRPHTILHVQKPEAESGFTLEVTAPLPSPLAPLKWPIRFSPGPQDLFSIAFVMPCLRSLMAARAEVNSLCTYIRDKDKIIAKLTDKLEASGIDLSAVFINAASSKGSRASTRAHVMSSVKGLREFDYNIWRAAVTTLPEFDPTDICNELFVADASNSNRQGLDSEKKGLFDRGLEVNGLNRDLTMDDQKSLPIRDSADNDFQRQVTPSREYPDPAPIDETIASNSRGASEPAVPEAQLISTSESDDDLDGPVAKARHSPITKHNPPRKEAKKLGVLGGTKKGHVNVETLPPESSTKNLPVEKNDAQGSSMVVSEEARASTESRQKNKLGKTGGHQKETPTTSRDTAEKPPPAIVKSATNTWSLTRTVERPGRQSVQKPASPPSPRETSQERADRNRERLKRELEEKSKVPVKKKRKF